MRWTASRKAEYLKALDGAESLASFARRYRASTAEVNSVSSEEIAAWRRLFAVDGKRGLRTTKLLLYRNRDRTPQPAGPGEVAG